MQAVVEKRYGKKPETQTPKPPDAKPDAKPDALREQHGIPALRKERDEVVGKLKTYEKTLAERDTELEGLKKQVTEFEGTRKEYDELKARVSEVEKERDAYKKLESVAALEQSPDFQKKYVEGRNAAVAHLKELATLADIPADDLEAALSKTGRARVQAMDDLLGSVSRYVSDDIVQTIRHIDGLDAEKHGELSAAEQRMQERRAAQETAERRGREERSAAREKAWQSTASALAKDIGLSDKDVADAGEFYKSNKDAAKAAEMVLKGKAFDAIRKERDDLKAELAKYDKATPRVEAGAAGHNGRTDPKEARKTLIQEAREAMGWR
jgi:hypothetical protein